MQRRKINYQLLSPFMLTDCLDDLSAGIIPDRVNKQLRGVSMRPFELMEDAVFFGFRSTLLLNVKKLGRDCLFQSEPEGVIICDNIVDPCAIIYECKSRKQTYKMSRKDMLSYKDYIARKQIEIRTLHHVPLIHFVIIGPSFAGDYHGKIRELQKSGITVSMVKGADLKHLFDEVDGWSNERLRLMDLTNIFITGVITYKQIKAELDRCERT